MQAFLLDTIIIFLLGAAITFCWRLNGKLNTLKDINFNLNPALQTLNQFANKFSDSLIHFKEQMKNTQTVLGKEIPKGKELKEDLELILEYCESATKRLETLIDEAKKSHEQLDETFKLVQKVLPKNFRDVLEQSDIVVDFDALRKEKMLNLESLDGAVLVPHKLESKLDDFDLYIDKKFIESMEDLH